MRLTDRADSSLVTTEGVPMGDTNIEWTDKTWNPTRGCSRVSDGCRNCFAERQAIRQIQTGYKGLIKRTSHGPAWTGAVRLVPSLYDAPLRWRKPRRIFVNSMSDLFHEQVSPSHIAGLFGIMAMAPQHTFQVLTKRPQRALEFFGWIEGDADGPSNGCILHARDLCGIATIRHEPFAATKWPLPNVHLGVSVENQETADERIPLLLQTPAAVRFVSYEPALGSINFRRINTHGGWYDSLAGWRDVQHSPAPEGALDWLIVGGESGPGARPCNVDWLRSAMQQCREAGVPCFVKQLGAKPYEQHNVLDAVYLMLKDRKGGDPSEWPIELMVREFPQ